MLPLNLFADPFNFTWNIALHWTLNMTCSSHSSLFSLLLSSAALIASVLVNQLLGAQSLWLNFNSSLIEILFAQLLFGCGPGHWYLSQLPAARAVWLISKSRPDMFWFFSELRTLPVQTPGLCALAQVARSALLSADRFPGLRVSVCPGVEPDLDRRRLKRSCQIWHFLWRAEPIDYCVELKLWPQRLLSFLSAVKTPYLLFIHR